MSAPNALVYIENIRAALVKYDPLHAHIYERNAKNYGQEILDAVAPFKHSISKLPNNKRWLVTSEGAFSYLARDYGLKELFLWPINADSQGTPQQVRHVIDTVRSNNINAIFSESTVSNKPALQVVRETDAHYAGVLYVDSLSNKEGPVPTYIDLLTTTLSRIAAGIKSNE